MSDRSINPKALGHGSLRRGLLFLVLLVVGLAVPFALFGGGGAAGALTAPITNVEVCVISNCATIAVTLYPANTTPGPSQAAPFTGNGAITSKPAGIDCTVTAGIPSGTCSFRFLWSSTVPSLDLTLIATPNAGSVGCRKYCATDQLQATPTLVQLTVGPGDSGTVDRFAFKLASEALTVSTKGDGSGTVTSAPAGIACGATCAAGFDYGTVVKLTAAPDAGASFTAWTGACAGQGKTCALTLGSALATNAVFGVATTTTTTSTTTTATPTVKTVTTPPTTTASTTTTVAHVPIPVVKQPFEVQLIAVRTVRSKLGAREIAVEISGNKTATVDLTLKRAGKRLAGNTLRALRRGDRVITLVVPDRVGSGRATIHIKVTAAAGGGHKTFQGPVNIPAP